jgi:hypothetical protein
VEHKAKSPSRIHMSCKWCGMDFGSLSGRDRHIRQVCRYRLETSTLQDGQFTDHTGSRTTPSTRISYALAVVSASLALQA